MTQIKKRFLFPQLYYYIKSFMSIPVIVIDVITVEAQKAFFSLSFK